MRAARSLPLTLVWGAALVGLLLLFESRAWGNGDVGLSGALAGHLARGALPATDATVWAVAGMSFLMAAVTHASVMAAFVAVELTGDWTLLLVLLGLNVLSWKCAARLSVNALYAITSQLPTHGSKPDE